MADNPFVRYRHRLDSYQRAIAKGWSDEQFVAVVEDLDQSIIRVEGRGFEVTPLAAYPALSPSGGQVWVKDDTQNVGGSHKARHLFGVALALAVDEDQATELAIASCGNAAIAASVIAKATDRPLRVFIPDWAEQSIVDTLTSNGARVEVCERRPDETGDPTYLRFMEAVRGGSTAFSVQSTATPTTLDGGRTMGWELADQIIDLGASNSIDVFIQVGGGALASATWLGLIDGLSDTDVTPVLYPVQTQACAPLARAWDLLSDRFPTMDRTVIAEELETHADEFMWPWEPVGTSAASGILDDVTYDWLPIVDGMLTSGGRPIVIDEATVVEAHERGRAATGIDAEATGTAGYGGLLAHGHSQQAVVLFTGVTR